MQTAGYFINLDRSVKRRRAIEAELSKVGLVKQYKRFPAIDGRTLNMRRFAVGRGEAGCFLSHIGALEAGRKTGQHFHVLEDDAVLCRGFASHLKAITDGPINDFDIVLTDMLVPPEPRFFEELLTLYEHYLAHGAFNMLMGSYWACLSSYVVNSKAAGKLIQLLRQEAEGGMSLPVDLCVGRLVSSGAVTAGCLFPFVSYSRMSHLIETTISRPGDSAAARTIVDSARAAFYVEADPGKIRADLAGIVATDLGQRLDQSAVDTLLGRIQALRAARDQAERG
jgi:GR25 family glycosyltransferase involved in LPS biosynthesis